MERIVLFALAALFATSSFAQNDKVEEVGDKAVDKGEQRVDRKIDQGLDAGFDKLEGVFFGKKKSKDKDSNSNASDADVPEGSSPEAVPTSTTTTGGVTIEENTDPFEPLDFTGSYRMVIHSYKNGSEEKDSPSEMTMAFNSDHMAMIPKNPNEKGNMRMVFDLRNKHTYTLITDEKGEKTGMKMKMMKVNVDGGEETKESGKVPEVVRTDETRTIEGHSCRKYTYKDEKGSGEAWIAEDVSFDMMAAFKQMVGGKGAQEWQSLPHSGMVMENTWNSANGKEKVTMFTKDLVVGKVDESLFSTSGFEVMDMTAMPMFGK